MKKIISLFLTIALFLTISGFAEDSISVTDSTIYLNNEVMQFSVPTILYYERTMVPMRELFEKLDIAVDWIDSEQKIIARSATKTMTMQIESLWIMCNDVNIPVDVSPILYESRTMIPLRFVCEQLNLYVEWDGDSNSIYLDSIGETVIGEAECTIDYENGTIATEKYYGEIIDGIPYGICTKTAYYTYSDGTKNIITSKGVFRNGVENGYIISDNFAAIFVDGMRNGWGWEIGSNGNYYEGFYEDDYFNNYCEIRYSNGNTYQGRVFTGYANIDGERKFLFASPNGEGEVYFSYDNSTYIGDFKYGLFHGNGTLYDGNGLIIYSGVFIDGYIPNQQQYAPPVPYDFDDFLASYGLNPNIPATNNGSSPTINNSSEITGMSFNSGSSVGLFYAGQQRDFTINFYSSGNVNPENINLIFTSSDTSIATVSGHGYYVTVNARRRGSVTITATAPNGVTTSMNLAIMEK